MKTEEENQPIISNQTIAQNEAIENVLARFREKEILIPQYQRDADQWDEIKKSLFIESILNRLTVPAFYFGRNEASREISEVIDGQQRLTTLVDFFEGKFTLSANDECPYFGNSAHYACKNYSQLAEVWQRAFRRYNLTLVTLPETADLSLRLEIFRRINEGGTPLSGQDIRLSYYSQSPCVRFIQVVGIFDCKRQGGQRMIENLGYEWPWKPYFKETEEWMKWWEESRNAIGQTASEVFLQVRKCHCIPGMEGLFAFSAHFILNYSLMKLHVVTVSRCIQVALMKLHVVTVSRCIQVAQRVGAANVVCELCGAPHCQPGPGCIRIGF
jgi:Protein of unknown function DUF262